MVEWCIYTWSGVTLSFSVHFCIRCCCWCNNLCFSRQNRLCLTLDIWDKYSIGLGKCTGWPFCYLDPWLWHWITKKMIVCMIKSENTHQITIKLGTYIPLVILITWLDFGRIVNWVGNFSGGGGHFLGFFFPNFGCVFQSHTLYISGMVGLIDMNQKGNALVGYWVNYVLPWPMT